MAKRRRGAGEGSIYKRADGTWAASLTVGYDENGRRRRRVLYAATRREVAEKLADLQHSARTGPVPVPERLRIGEFLDRWMRDTARACVRPTTALLYAGWIANHLKPRLGGLPLQALRAEHVQSMLAGMERDGASPRLRQQVFTLLRCALADGVRWRRIAHNPAALVERPRAPRREMRALSEDEAQRLLEAAQGHRLEALFVLALGTGARHGELFGLRWGDLDEGARTLTIQRTLLDVNGTLQVGEPKTAAARRRIDLPAFAVAALRAHRAMLGALPHPERFVFTDERGGPLRKSNFNRRVWRPLVVRAGLHAELRFHDLRHSFASFLLARGVHPRVAQSMLGHADVGTTLATYSHVGQGLGREAASQLDALLGGG